MDKRQVRWVISEEFLRQRVGMGYLGHRGRGLRMTETGAWSHPGNIAKRDCLMRWKGV